MIYIAEVCTEINVKGEKGYHFDFQCEHCYQSFNNDTFNLSILIHGAAFLVGPKFGCIGFTCPSCLKTNLLKGERLKELQQIMLLFRGPNDSHLNPLPRYHSSVIYNPAQIEQLGSYNIPTWTCPLTQNSKENFHALLAAYLQEEPQLEQEWLNSYIYGGEPPMGTVASVWWFQPDDIESLLQIENDSQVRVFPRYFHKMSWHEKYDGFCWSYKLYQEYLAGLKDSADDNFYLLREYAYQEDINLDRLLESDPGITTDATVEFLEQHAQQRAENDIQVASEFLDLLVNYDPAPWDIPGAMSDFYKELWKSPTPFKGASVPDSVEDFNQGKYRPNMTDAEISEISDKVRAHITKGHIQDWAIENHKGFIADYISIARRSDFSYGLVWDLKCRYLQQLHDIVGTVEFDETKYAFVSEQKAWRIKFDGKVIGGLKTKGFRYIHYLVANEGIEIDVFSLGSLDGGPKGIISKPNIEDANDEEEFSDKGSDKTDVNEIADSDLKEIYENRIAEIEREIEDAKKMRDNKLIKEFESELKMVKKLYNDDFWKGESRNFDDGTMKARKAITRAITRAINEIEGKNPIDQNKFRTTVASHFREALKPISLYKISYTPKEAINWMLR